MSKSVLRPEHSPGNQVRQAHRMFERMLWVFLAPHGLTPGFWYYLRVLWQEDGLTQRELSDRTHVAETTTVSMLAAMQAAGFIERQRNSTDRRKVNVYLTQKGRDLEDVLLPLAAQINMIATSGIPFEKVEVCLDVLRQMSNNMSAYDGEDGESDYIK